MRIVDARKEQFKIINTGDLANGDTMIVTDGDYTGVVVLKTYQGWVNLANPAQTWSHNPRFYGVRVDATVTITEPVPF